MIQVITFINLEGFVMKNIINNIQQNYIDFSVSDFYNMYSNGETNVYFKAANMSEYNRKYLGYRNSIIVLLQLV